MEWLAFKMRSLNEDGLYILTDQEDIVLLTEDEKNWNIHLRRKEEEKAKAKKVGEREPSSAASSSMTESVPPAAAPTPAANFKAPPAIPKPMPKPKPDVQDASASPPAATSERPPTTAVEPKPCEPTPTNPPLPPGPPPSTMPPGAGVQKIPPWRRHEENTTSKKRSASAGQAARVREPEGAKAKAVSAKPPPRPARDVPHFVLQAHEVRVGDELDTDWTLSADWAHELRLREERNQIIKDMLLEGKTVGYRQSGWSLWPKVHSNDLCCYMPVKFDESVKDDDVVFCEVQPMGHFYAHLVKSKEWSNERRCYDYWISNLQGRINGWCNIPHIHGKLFQVLH